MRQIREVLRLVFEEGLSQRVVARALGVARSTVERLITRFRASGLAWPLSSDVDDVELERRMYRGVAHAGHAKACVRPDYTAVARALTRKGVTRRLLWEEYRDQHADGIGYSVFCDELAAYLGDRDLSYRHDPVPGEKGYFDFAGMTLRYLADDGRERAAQVFTAALGWSNAIYARAYADQTAASWLDGQQRAFAAFGGVPKVGVPDNPKALIARADRYEPTLTPVYADFARHYGVAIVPARVRKPKDKASVEGAVKIVEMRVLARARDRVFASLVVLNAWLDEQIAALNAAPFTKRVGNRAAMLAEERTHLLPLPATPFEAPVYLKRKVARDYHVDVFRQYYSVPHHHYGATVQVRVTTTHVEVLLADQRIALHRRQPTSTRFVTDPQHMPAHHRAYRDPQIAQRAATVGPKTSALIDSLFAKRRHPEQAIRSAQGILGLLRDHDRASLEAACARAIELDTIGYEPVRRLLRRNDAQVPLDLPPRVHEHVRGGDYFAVSPEVDHAA